MSMAVSLHDVAVRRRGKSILGPITTDMAGTGFTIILGPNGSGKTTFLKVLHGVERISDGALEWSIPETEARQAQAYVFQSPIMLRRSVAANLAYPLQLEKLGKPAIAKRVSEWAQRIGLSDALDRPATRLSGGEKQKLAIGRALIRQPKVLFLDEPCANLDGRATREIEALLLDANQRGTRIIMSTHNLGQAKRLATDVLFLLNGRIHERGDADVFFAKPSGEESAAFLKGDIVE